MADSTRIWAGKPDQLQGKAPSPFEGKRFTRVYFLLAFSACMIGLGIIWNAVAHLTLTTSEAQKHLASMSNQVDFAINNADARFNVGVAGEPVIGPENAPVTIVEFGDFQCPFCKRFHMDVEQALLRKYMGKIRFVFRDFPMIDMHPLAGIAAEAAQCAGDQGKFWEYHNLLFRTQPQRDYGYLLTLAKQLSLNVKLFESCLDTQKYAQHILSDHCDGLLLGINGTPTFFINGRKLVGAQPLSTFSTYIDAELASHPSATAAK